MKQKPQKKAYEDALAARNNSNTLQPPIHQQTPPQSTQTPTPVAPTVTPNGGSQYGDDYYKQENGTVYEWDDDGYWDPETDKKIEEGVVYEYDDGYWEADEKVENGVAYEWDDGRWELDDDNERDDDNDDD